MDAVALAAPSEALARIEGDEEFDVAVLDMMMPGMDGLALAHEIRRHRDERELPLVLLTSFGRLPQGESSRVFAVQLAKPVKASQLYNALLKALAAHAQEADAGESITGEAKPAPSSLRILLAEDNAVNQKVAVRLLDQLGYRADVVENGLQVLEALARRPYDVVLMDVQMPELDGLDASRRIRERWSREERPRIVAMTANALPEDREACFAAGMDDYLAKPIHPEELGDALNRVHPVKHADGAVASHEGMSLETGAVEDLRDLGGEEFLVEVIDTFLDDAPVLISTLRTSHERGDAEELRRTAHSLKSNGQTFGALEFADLSRDLEERANQGDPERGSELSDQSHHHTVALETALVALREAAS